jgi:hypothetical protein
MTALRSLLQRIRQTLIHLRQARHGARMDNTRAPRMRPQGSRASHGVNMARLARAMPEANPLTLEITASILASDGLLDEQPSFKPPAWITRRSPWPTRVATGERP